MKVLSLFFTLIFSFSSFASPLPDFPFVTVTGSSNIKVAPNTANLTFNIVIYDKNSDSGKLTLDNTSLEVINLFNKFDVDKSNITSSEISKRAKRNRDNNYQELEVIGYEFTQHFEVTLDNLKNFSEISASLLMINHIENLNSHFDINNRDAVEIELIKEAAQKAKLKATQMAAGLGVTIDSVFAFNDTGSFPSFFATFGLNEQAYRTMRARQVLRGNQQSALMVPQFIEVSKTVNVVYKITQ